jgi:hypothetical protein
VLAGSHTWYNFQDGGASNPPPAFDYVEWLDYITARGHNFYRLWRMENGAGWPTDADQYFRPEVYARPGPGTAGDGEPKYDLTTFNQAFFDRMRARIIAAGQRNIYVAVLLFNGFSVESKGGAENPWLTHPYNLANNINSVDGDPNSTGEGSDTHRLVSSTITNLQKAYIAKVIDTVNDLDNVLYEISNESNSTSQAWQYELIAYIRSYEAGKPKQHPVGMSVEYPGGSNTELTTSDADWIAPNGSITAPATNDGTKVVIWDTDHITGIELSDVHWPWRTFCRGNQPLYMDQYDGAEGAGSDIRSDATVERMRYNIGYVRDYAARIPLLDMTPQDGGTAPCSTGYCLHGAHEYLCYQPATADMTLNLTSETGTFQVEKFNPADGSTQATTTTGGGTRTLTRPSGWTDWVAYVYQ